MSNWFDSKRLFILLLGLLAITEWQNGYIPIPRPILTTWLVGVYIGGQSLVDCCKALKGGK